MKRYYLLAIMVEAEDQDEWDASCDETHALIRVAHILEQSPQINKALLMSGYLPITKSEFDILESESMDAKGV